MRSIERRSDGINRNTIDLVFDCITSLKLKLFFKF
jgi:hypothetical protein